MKCIALLVLLLLAVTAEDAGRVQRCLYTGEKLANVRRLPLTSLLTIWNAGAQKCLGFGYVRHEREPPFVKRGSGAEASLDVCHVRYGPSGDVRIVTEFSSQLLNLTLKNTLDSDPPKGHSTKFYGLSSEYHQCIFLSDDHRPKLLTSDQEEDCRSDHDVVKLVIPDDDWRHGAWIAAPLKGNLTQIQCLTALDPTLDQAQARVQFDDCSATNWNQRWYLCNIQVQDCTPIMKRCF